MSEAYFRVHPSINFARVGTSAEFYIAPETAAGKVVDKTTGQFGGLPIKKGTENIPIEEADLRDEKNNPLRQAARFRVFAYDQPQQQYPAEDHGREVKVGDTVGGKVIQDIVWQVHLANKKANNYRITSDVDGEKKEEGVVAYEDGKTPPLRNPQIPGSASDANRLRTLVIDAGPRALSVAQGNGGPVPFNASTPASHVNQKGQVESISDYPFSFPDDHFTLYNPRGPIDSLGEMQLEAGTGRLLVTGGYGKASGIITDGAPPELNDAIDNNKWFDDTSDGPVIATIVFNDGSITQAVQGWIVCTDPGFAPQTRNVVSCWDDIYNTWVEQLGLVPEMFANGQYNASYDAAFDEHVQPIFHAALLQRWNTNLPSGGVNGHNFVASIQPGDDPKKKIPNLKSLIRDPNKPEEDEEGVKMPLALGDAMRSFLSLSPTQYFLLMQWYDGKSTESAPALGEGERLDQVALENCLGGRYSPGIDLTFIVRDVHFYEQNWQGKTGPFRVNMQTLDYSKVQSDKPFLSEGYIPLRSAPVEPGDLCKFMSLPWHTDYNSCATHTPDPNKPKGNNTLYWSWPGQRPVNVYPASQCTFDGDKWNLGGQVFSVRGNEGHGTETGYPQQEGRYQCYFDFVENWQKVGFIIQGTQIPAEQGGHYGSDKFLEVASLFETDGQVVEPWPTAVLPGYKAPTDCGPKG
ncbi:LodA/GoxA family CTQ-dependent oxidase [Marinimicrobium agarilyticum]|uniref:LodA/GoxA family CTQ-dependent oxidase n=1 Tax=Marinimicrobium agarilyticum TaxID=306546 RepID=UPI000424720C|nr:LodA/GoxA family CTQ-dependent oxidase [Marinimicrobium agarilyticum]